jgi:cell division ATPase FtsA
MPEVYQLGPATYTVSTAVTAGQVVMVDGTTGLVKPATAAATTCLGVARDDAAPAGSGSSTNFATLRPEVAVYSAPYEVKVTAAADCAFGVKVIAAANGQVTPGAVVGQIVGYVTEPAGITAGNKGRIKLV